MKYFSFWRGTTCNSLFPCVWCCSLVLKRSTFLKCLPRSLDSSYRNILTGNPIQGWPSACRDALNDIRWAGWEPGEGKIFVWFPMGLLRSLLICWHKSDEPMGVSLGRKADKIQHASEIGSPTRPNSCSNLLWSPPLPNLLMTLKVVYATVIHA